MPAICFEVSDREGMGVMEHLWNELNDHHISVSKYFKDYYVGRSFAGRKEEILGKPGLIDVRLEIAKFRASGEPVGYCISTITNDYGEIDSIYVKKDFRGIRIGESLVEHAMDWMDARGIESRKVSVAYGNDRVLDFYRKFSFYPGFMCLSGN